MSVKPAPWADELTKLYEAALLELPSAAVRRLFTGDDQGFSEAGWKAYDSWVRLANETANQLYANRAFGELAGRAFETALGLQRLNDPLAPVFFETLWHALGLPTASNVEALHDEATALRQEHRALAAGGHLSKPTKVITGPGAWRRSCRKGSRGIPGRRNSPVEKGCLASPGLSRYRELRPPVN